MAAAIRADVRAVRAPNTPKLRAVRRKYSRILRDADAGVVFRLAALLQTGPHRWIGYELIRSHDAAFSLLNGVKVEALGRGIDSWWTVDSFARTISGPAWLHGRIGDGRILRWARAKDRWWRRTAVVSTVALNSPSDGGTGDAPRTLRICRRLAADRDDMVVKGMSWALRVLAMRDPRSVRGFLKTCEKELAPRVKREVRNKLETGLKNPGKRRR